jgi:hypothetical protein
MVTGYVVERAPNSVAGVSPAGTDDTEIASDRPEEVSR